MIWHYLFHGHTHGRQIAGQAVDVYVEQQRRILGPSIYHQVVKRRQKRDANVRQEEELHHLHLTP